MNRAPDAGHRYVNLSELSPKDRKQLADAMAKTPAGQARLQKMKDARAILAPVFALGATLRMPETEFNDFLTEGKTL